MKVSEEKIGKLGFGCMRFPKKDGKDDVEQTKKMFDVFMEAGYNYFDTAWNYEGSEETVKKALVDRYPRDRYFLASKLAPWSDCGSMEEAKAQFDTSLARTGAGYFDFYLLHNLGDKRTALFDEYGLWDYIFEKKKAGLIRHVGFSMHDHAEVLDEILTRHPELEFVQLQINYADWNSTVVQSRKCYEVARKHGIPIIIMEPVKGGMLADPPKPIRDAIDAFRPEYSYAAEAIRFAMDLEGVVTVLSGMSSVEQVRDNIAAIQDFAGLSEKEKEIIAAAQQAIKKTDMIPCTFCNYCTKVCPENIGIPESFVALNTWLIYGNMDEAKHDEDWQTSQRGKRHANECIGCGLCEGACPQYIEIRKNLRRVSEEILA